MSLEFEVFENTQKSWEQRGRVHWSVACYSCERLDHVGPLERKKWRNSSGEYKQMTVCDWSRSQWQWKIPTIRFKLEP